MKRYPGVLMVEEKWCEKGMEEKLLDGTTLGKYRTFSCKVLQLLFGLSNYYFSSNYLNVCAVAGVLRGNALFVANVGDSELVVSRRGKAEVVTVQHNPSKNEVSLQYR